MQCLAIKTDSCLPYNNSWVVYSSDIKTHVVPNRALMHSLSRVSTLIIKTLAHDTLWDSIHSFSFNKYFVTKLVQHWKWLASLTMAWIAGCTLRTIKHSRSPRWCLWHCSYRLHPPTRYLSLFTFFLANHTLKVRWTNYSTCDVFYIPSIVNHVVVFLT